MEKHIRRVLMQFIADLNSKINGIVWGLPMMVLILGVGTKFLWKPVLKMIKDRWLRFRSVRTLRSHYEEHPG